MPRMSPARVVGFVAAFCLSVALGNLIGSFFCPNHVAAAIAPSIQVARTSSVEAIIAPSDSAIELLAETTGGVLPVLRTADAPSPAKEVTPTRATSPPKAAPRPQRRAPVRYASRDPDDE
jgi:hypothetical protein